MDRVPLAPPVLFVVSRIRLRTSDSVETHQSMTNKAQAAAR